MSTTSPCTRICRIEQDSRLCLGCARTLDEIAIWRGASEADKKRIWAELPARRAKLGVGSCEVPPTLPD